MSLASLLAVTIALFAVLRFWTVPVAYRRGDPPWSALWPSPMSGINAIETVKRCAVFPIAPQRAWAHSKGAKCLIRPISF
jgi:hypothetical protein